MNEPYVRSSSLDRHMKGKLTTTTVDGTVTEYNVEQTLTDANQLSGYKNPRWRDQVRRGVQAGTALSASRTKFNYKSYELQEIFNWTGSPRSYYTAERYNNGRHFITVPSPSFSVGQLEAKADNQALSAFVSKAEEARRVLLSGETIGEWAQLVRQIASPGKSLRRGLGAYVDTVKNRVTRHSVRRLPKYRRSAEQLKIVGDTWLEYNFGWRPLVSEIDATLEYINESDPFSRHDQRNIKAASFEEDSSWIGGSSARFQIVGGTPGVTARSRQVVRVLVIYQGSVRMSSSSVGYVAEKVGFHPSQWVPTLWELIPYSFAIDYFTNIGDIISALNFPESLIPWRLRTVVVTKRGFFCDQKPLWSEPQSGSSSTWSYTTSRLAHSLGAAEVLYSSVQRNPTSGSLVPYSSIQIPGSGTKWLNLASLFTDAKVVQKLLR